MDDTEATTPDDDDTTSSDRTSRDAPWHQARMAWGGFIGLLTAAAAVATLFIASRGNEPPSVDVDIENSPTFDIDLGDLVARVPGGGAGTHVDADTVIGGAGGGSGAGSGGEHGGNDPDVTPLDPGPTLVAFETCVAPVRVIAPTGQIPSSGEALGGWVRSRIEQTLARTGSPPIAGEGMITRSLTPALVAGVPHGDGLAILRKGTIGCRQIVFVTLSDLGFHETDTRFAKATKAFVALDVQIYDGPTKRLIVREPLTGEAVDARLGLNPAAREQLARRAIEKALANRSPAWPSGVAETDPHDSRR